MANHASAEKRNRQRIVRTEQNRTVKSTLRTFVKRVRVALQAKDKKTAQEALRAAASKLDRAAKTGAIHFKAASRTISRLSIAVSKLA